MSDPQFLLDTGPLAASFDPRDQYYAWALKTIPQIQAPLMTCEPVLTEAFYLLSKTHNGIGLLGSFCESGALQIDFRLLSRVKEIGDLMRKYRDIPMSLADACLVLLAEQHENAAIITTDRDFLIYRTRARRRIHLLSPFSP